MPSNRDPKFLYPDFREKVAAVMVDMNIYAMKHMKGYKWVIVEGFRTAEYQNELYQKGRTRPGSIVTHRDGYKKKSNHQSGLSVDLAPKHGFSIDWNIPNKHWDYLGHVARKHGLEWGGDWKSPDRPHIEWPESDKATYKKASDWVKTL